MARHPGQPPCHQNGMTRWESRHLFCAIETHGNGKDLGQYRDFGRKIVRNLYEKTSGNDVHVLRPAAKKIRGILGIEKISVVEGVFAAAVGKIVPTVVAFPQDTFAPTTTRSPTLSGMPSKSVYSAVAADCSNRTHIFVTLDQGKFEFAGTVLRSEALEGVFVRATDA